MPTLPRCADKAHYGRRFRALSVVVAAVLMAISGWATGAAADDPPVPPSVTLAPGGPTTTIVAGSTPGSAPGSTVPGGVTSTTLTTPSVTAGPGGFGAPHTDPEAPPEPPMPDPSPEVHVLLEQLNVQDESKIVDLHHVEVQRIAAREKAVADRLTQARRSVAAASAAVRATQDQLRQDALVRYMSPGATGLPRIAAAQDTLDRTRIVLSDVTIDEHVRDREKALERLASHKREVVRRKADLGAAHRVTNAAGGREAKAETQLTKQRADLASARSLGAGWSLPIEGDSAFTGPELAQWFISRGHPSRARVPMTQLADAYISEGKDQKIRGDMAFAQSVLETGSFSNPDTIGLNNFAGIGHCDSCGSGFAFATPLLGVRAQVQLLAQYAQRGVHLAHPLVDRRLHGPSGCCQTWRQLTHTWATNGNYGAKIMGVYREMLWWLVDHRGMTPLVGPR